MTVIKKRPKALSRRGSTGGTSEEAARFVRPRLGPICQAVLDEIEKAPSTGEEVFERLTEAGIRTTLYTVKPRLSDLARNMGLITDSGRRGTSYSGRCKSIIWRATTEEERKAFLDQLAANDSGGGA